MAEMLETIGEMYQFMASDNDLWDCLAIMVKKFVDALERQGFTREESLAIVPEWLALLSSLSSI